MMASDTTTTITRYFTTDPALGAPNPRVTAMAALEKGIELTEEVVDLVALDNRSPDGYAQNPTGTLPYVQLSDGTFLSETIAICELMEEEVPSPTLFGETTQERAIARMWQRRVEQQICLPIISGLRWGPAKVFFAERGMHGLCANDEAAAQQFAVAKSQVKWLDQQMQGAGNQPYIAGESFTIADLQLFVFLDWAASEGGPVPDILTHSELPWVTAWFRRIHARPSAAHSDPSRTGRL
jgi:glutathione S-transferase